MEQKLLQRYRRQLPVIGLQGQKKLQQAKILCIGAGGLGSATLLYLAACGIGKIGIVDGDVVELSNLQRQILYTTDDVGQSKAVQAAKHIQALNNTIDTVIYQNYINADNAANMIADYDVIVDGSDNYYTRYLVNDYCQLQQKPLIYASVLQYAGQISVFNYQNGPCLRCLYLTPPPENITPSCAQAGVLGVLPGLLGILQATEVIKLVLKKDTLLSGRLLTVDALTMIFTEFPVRKNTQCPLCQHQQMSAELFQENTVDTPSIEEITPQQLIVMQQAVDKEIYLLDVREPYEREICHIGGELIPLNTLLSTGITTDKSHHIVIYCRSGQRSMTAAKALVTQGYENVYNLQGGILQWANAIDPTLATY